MPSSASAGGKGPRGSGEWANDEQFRRLVESVTDYAIFMLDRDGCVVSWNLGAERLKGYTSQEIIGQHFSRFYPPESLDASLPARALEVAADLGRFENEGWRVRKDGSRFWANVIISRLGDDDGKLIGFTKVTRDLTERREAERRLERKTRFFETIFDSIGDSITVCDDKGRFIYTNQASRELTGDASQLDVDVDRSIHEYGVFLPDGVTPFPPEESTLLKALRGIPSDNVHAIMRNAVHPEGVDLDVTTRPLRDSDGDIFGAVVIAHDVTTAKGIERELARQQTLLRSVLDCVVDTISVFDAQGTLILSNPAFLNLVGRRIQQTPTVDERMSRYGLFRSDAETPLRREDAPAMRALQGQIVEDMEIFVRSPQHPDGVLMSTNARPLKSASGETIGAVVTGRDVTARRKAERESSEQAKLLTTILDCAADCIVVYDTKGQVLHLNRAAEKFMPQSSRAGTFEERVSRFSIATADGIPVEAKDSPPARALRGEVLDDVEVIIRSANMPEPGVFSISGRPLQDDAGRNLGAVVTFRDVTSTSRARLEREALLAELHRSNEELAQFAHVASHDLRAPLRAIDSLAEWLERDLRPHFSGENSEQMRLLRNRVSRLDRLLRDLLEYSKVGRLTADVDAVDVDKLLADIIELSSPPQRFQIRRDVAVSHLETAALPLKRALLNLVSNAIKHHDKDEGHISISARDAGSSVEFDVTDDGPGIPARHHDRVFQMFQTLRPRDETEGSGMGLAFVKKLAEQAGGSIRLLSEGRGARFRLTWPKNWRPRAPS